MPATSQAELWKAYLGKQREVRLFLPYSVPCLAKVIVKMLNLTLSCAVHLVGILCVLIAYASG